MQEGSLDIEAIAFLRGRVQVARSALEPLAQFLVSVVGAIAPQRFGTRDLAELRGNLLETPKARLGGVALSNDISKARVRSTRPSM